MIFCPGTRLVFLHSADMETVSMVPEFQPVDASKNTCFINEAQKKSVQIL